AGVPDVVQAGRLPRRDSQGAPRGGRRRRRDIRERAAARAGPDDLPGLLLSLRREDLGPAAAGTVCDPGPPGGGGGLARQDGAQDSACRAWIQAEGSGAVLLSARGIWPDQPRDWRGGVPAWREI